LRGDALIVIFLTASLAGAADAAFVSIIADRAAPPPVRHGLAKVEEALRTRGVRVEETGEAKAAHGAEWIVTGRAAADAVKAMDAALPAAPESLLIRRGRWNGKPVVVAAGGDAVGLMYALLDIADRIGWAADSAHPLSEVRDGAEQPRVAERGVTIFTMQQAHFEGRLHDARYWERYFDNLARNRFNTFQVLFAYEMDGYMYPPYPYFFDIEGYPEVKVIGLAKEQQRRNLDDLNRLIRMAHERGLKVTIGIWDHIYRDLGSGLTPFYKTRPKTGLVEGVNDQNLVPFTRAALAQFVHKVQGIDRIMFLLHGESGLKTEEMPGFWASTFRMLRQEAPQIRYEARAKGVPDDIIEDGIGVGLNLRMNTKYWAEQVGLPYHPTHVQALNQFDRRHGYSDMLIYPHQYGLHWTLWTSGTPRVLLWADPAYARRFAATVHMAGTEGFDLMEPLATKMAGHPHDMKPFELLRPQHRYYDYEFERYWHFFQVFGRLTYNPETPAEVWDREFARRFGDAGTAVEEALHRSSGILPRAIAYCLPPNRFPTTRGWAERQRQEDLPAYAAAEPSDTQQFESFADAARRIVAGGETAKRTPLETAAWFARASADVLRLAAEAERRAGAQRGKEFESTLVDLRITANLALYHSRRIPAGLDYALYRQTHDVNALDDAIAAEKSASEAWERVVEAAGDFYNDDLMMGLADYDLSGHWRDELAKLKAGIAALEREREAFRPPTAREALRVEPASVPRSGVVSAPLASGSYTVTVAVDGAAGPMWVEANGADFTDTFTAGAGERGEKKLVTTVADGRLSVVFGAPANGRWRAGAVSVAPAGPAIAHVPVRRLAPGEDLVVRATVRGAESVRAVRVVYGSEASGFRAAALENTGPYRYGATILAARLGAGMEYYVEAEDNSGRRARWPESGRVRVAVTADREPPVVRHTPATAAEPGAPLAIAAEVEDASGVKWVRVRYRGLTQHQDYRTLEMLPSGRGREFRAEIPGAHIDRKFDFQYFIEAMDEAGNGRIYPDLETETPYVVVPVRR